MYIEFKTFLEKLVSIDNEEWNCIKKHLHLKKYKKRDILQHAGEVSKEIRFINSGIARMYYIDEKAKELTCQISANNKKLNIEDRFIGDYNSFLQQKPSNLFIEALSDCEIIEITYDDLKSLYKKIKKIETVENIIKSKWIESMQKEIMEKKSLSHIYQ